MAIQTEQEIIASLGGSARRLREARERAQAEKAIKGTTEPASSPAPATPLTGGQLPVVERER